MHLTVRGGQARCSTFDPMPSVGSDAKFLAPTPLGTEDFEVFEWLNLDWMTRVKEVVARPAKDHQERQVRSDLGHVWCGINETIPHERMTLVQDKECDPIKCSQR